MKVAVLGGGPAGLYFAISMKLSDAAHDVTVVERNRPDDTFGWGVVLSDETLDNLARQRSGQRRVDPRAFRLLGRHRRHPQGRAHGLDRPRLLRHRPQAAARTPAEAGARARRRPRLRDRGSRPQNLHAIARSGGRRRRLELHARATFTEVFKPDIDTRKCKFVWLGTHQKFDDAFTFIFEETEHGWVWAHAYQFEPDTATFIVECSEQTWQRFGFGEMTQQESIATCERIFQKHLGGHALMTNANHIRGSAWINFPRVLCERWRHQNVVLWATPRRRAHFSIGSGTKLALESAVALAEYLHSEPDLEAAFRKYEDERRPKC